MNLRITATYAATDGTMPESVDVVWDDLEVGNHPNGADIADVINLLIAAPGVRRSTYVPNSATTIEQDGNVSAGRKYRAGIDIAAGMTIGFDPNGFTLYPLGHERATFPAGVAVESIDAGTAMQKDELQSRPNRVAWIKERA